MLITNKNYNSAKLHRRLVNSAKWYKLIGNTNYEEFALDTSMDMPWMDCEESLTKEQIDELNIILEKIWAKKFRITKNYLVSQLKGRESRIKKLTTLEAPQVILNHEKSRLEELYKMLNNFSK